MRGKWGRAARGRQARNSFNVEFLEDRLPLSHAALAAWAEAPDRDANLAFQLADDVALIESVPALIANFSGERSIDALGERVAISLSYENSGESSEAPRFTIAGTPGVINPTIVIPRLDDAANLNIDRLDDRFLGAISSSTDLFARAQFASVMRLEFSHDSFATMVHSAGDFEMHGSDFAGVPREQWAGHVADKDAAAEVPRFAYFQIGTEQGADAPQGSVRSTANPPAWTQAPMVAQMAAAPTLSPSAVDDHSLVVVSPTFESELGQGADELMVAADDSDAAPAEDRFELVRDRVLESALATTAASATTFLTELYGLPAAAFTRASLLDTMQLNATALDAALDDVLREVEGLGVELISWADEVRLPRWAMTAVAVVATGAGGALVVRMRNRRPGDETLIEDSSTWLFARFQDPTDVS